ncbi:VWA domain-containing protein [Alloiococcus sp. CFN-8]|uniref:VWA domain-containing protein n=1 Tax=Alloiococcus sp. CFN-8 TaxID=3416081 RepID=UPI003CE86715
MKKINKTFSRISFFMVVIILTGLFVFNDRASSDTPIDDSPTPELQVTPSHSQVNVGVNEEFTVKYTFTPSSIPKDSINVQNTKDIVLVIDTSGSMKENINQTSIENPHTTTTRLQALKDAAINFINKFKDDRNTNISIVTYDYRAEIKKELVNSNTNNSTLTTIINSLQYNGGTNIGDGIRKALSIMKDSTAAKKYIILMTDGEPTNYSYYIEYVFLIIPIRRYYENIDTLDKRVNAIGNSRKGLEYSERMAQKIKDRSLKNYLIGFSNGVNSNNLNKIAGKSGGVYKEALNADALNSIYNEIADEIKADYVTEDIRVNLNIPSNLSYIGSLNNVEINGNKYTFKIPNIKYTLNSSTRQYEAQTFDISLSFKPSKSGSYIFSGTNWNFTYKDLKKSTITKPMPMLNINVTAPNMSFELTRNIKDNTTREVGINKSFIMNYNIKPTAINATYAVKPKEVILVLDTSSTMSENLQGVKANSEQEKKLSILKNAANNFINQMNGDSNVKIGIVNFNSGATAIPIDGSEYLVTSNQKDKLKQKIDSLKVDNKGGSNIGDAIRKSLWLLTVNSQSNSEKFIVVIGNGEADYYTYKVGEENEHYSTIDNESSEGGKVGYSLGNTSDDDDDDDVIVTRATEYARAMSQRLRGQTIMVNSYFITLGAKADNKLFTDMANDANGIFIDNKTAGSEALVTNMKNIANEVRSEFIIKNLQLTENLPKGLLLSNNQNTATLKFPDLIYVYNDITKKYEANEINAALEIIGKALGNYNLTGDAIFTYSDIENVGKTLSFSPFNVSIVDDVILKQGLFQNDPTEGKPSGEGYLLYENSQVDIAEVSSARLAALVRNSGEETTLSITINSTKDPGINHIKITEKDIVVYKVDSDNRLQRLNINPANIVIDYGDNKTINLKIKLSEGDRSNYNYYIINYNFSAKLSGEHPGNINCSATLEGTNKRSDFKIRAVSLPDVF